MLDLIQEFEAFDHFSETGMVAIEVRGAGPVEDDEELRTARVAAGVRHGQDALVVVLVSTGQLTINFVARAASSGAVGTAPLHHESGNDPVEFEAIVITFAGQIDKVCHGLGRIFRKEIGDENAAVGGDFCLHGTKVMTPIPPPTLHTVPAVPWLFIRLAFPMAEAAQHMDPAIQEVLQVLSRQSAVPAGPLICRHLARPTTHFDLQLGFPVGEDRPLEEMGRVRLGELPATLLLRTTYSGPYDGLAMAWRVFSAAVPALLVSHPQMEQTGCFRESYLTDPSREPDPARWETVLELELKEGAGEK